MEIVGLQHGAHVGLIRRAAAQPLEPGVLVAEGFQKGIGECGPVEGFFREGRYGLLNPNGVHCIALTSRQVSWTMITVATAPSRF